MESLLGSTARESFYHLANVSLQGRACQGLACFAARKDAPDTWQRARSSSPPIYCLGQCYRGPAIFNGLAVNEIDAITIGVDSAQAVLLSNILSGSTRDLGSYQQKGGGAALKEALVTSPAELIDQVTLSGLRGRGGAGFPAGRKWQVVAQAEAPRKYLVVNAGEGDPGAFGDRFLMEDDPFRLIEACVIAAIAVGAEHGYIYLRREYPQAQAVLQDALTSAQEHNWLGEHILGSTHRFHLTLVMGQGSYVCGEETAMLNALEGLRPEVRIRPPQPAQQGLQGTPTLVHNVETLCALPWILTHGAEAYARLGFGKSRGTKLICLNSVFRRPGLYEIEFGASLRYIVDKIGGGLVKGNLKGVMIGGPLAGLVPPGSLDTPFDYEALAAIGAAVGHGGIIAFREDTTLADIMAEVFRFGAVESCGKCTPCHFGSAELAHMFEDVLAGKRVDGKRWSMIVDALEATSLCGHGRGLAEFARSLERYNQAGGDYREELAQCFT